MCTLHCTESMPRWACRKGCIISFFVVGGRQGQLLAALLKGGQRILVYHLFLFPQSVDFLIASNIMKALSSLIPETSLYTRNTRPTKVRKAIGLKGCMFNWWRLWFTNRPLMAYVISARFWAGVQNKWREERGSYRNQAVSNRKKKSGGETFYTCKLFREQKWMILAIGSGPFDVTFFMTERSELYQTYIRNSRGLLMHAERTQN